MRNRNTLRALHALERAHCLTDQEYRVLDDSYRFLRKVEHRLQLMFDLQTHSLPTHHEELRKLALRMSYFEGVRGQGSGVKERDEERGGEGRGDGIRREEDISPSWTETTQGAKPPNQKIT